LSGGIRIARLVPDDWAAFRDVRLAALAEAPYAFGSTLAYEQGHDEAAWRSRLDSRAQFAVRDGDGAVIGTAGALGAPPVIRLISMWIAPAARGGGLGEALVRHVIAYVRELGARELQLAVALANPGAERLYERCGFRRIGTPFPIRDGEPALEIEMTLSL
jgi:RimJ/RimL family protein N-acetyltransferase